MSSMTLSPTGATITTTRVRPARTQRTQRPQPGELRLTRRGRLVVFLGALVLLLAAAVFWGAGSVATERPEPTRVVVVDQGDTLWAIASEITADGDVRGMVDRIEALNGLDSAGLQVGQKLRVPVGG